MSHAGVAMPTGFGSDPTIELRYTGYDLVDGAERIRNSDYPQADEFASGCFLDPPSEAEMIDVFERAALSSRSDDA